MPPISATGARGGCSTVASTLVRRQAAQSSTWLTTWYLTRSLLWLPTTSRWRCAVTNLRWNWLSRYLRPMLMRAKSEYTCIFKDYWESAEFITWCASYFCFCLSQVVPRQPLQEPCREHADEGSSRWGFSSQEKGRAQLLCHFIQVT